MISSLKKKTKKQQSDRLGDFLGYLQLYEEEGKCNIPLSQMRSRQKTVELCTTSNVPKVMEVIPLPDSPANTHPMTSFYLHRLFTSFQSVEGQTAGILQSASAGEI